MTKNFFHVSNKPTDLLYLTYLFYLQFEKILDIPALETTVASKNIVFFFWRFQPR